MKSMRDSDQRIKLTIEVDTDGAWSSNRGMVAPCDYPRAITALSNMIANMKEECGEWGIAFASKESLDQ